MSSRKPNNEGGSRRAQALLTGTAARGINQEMVRNGAFSTAMSRCASILLSALGAIVGVGLNLILLVGSLDAAAQVLPTQQVGRQQDGTVVTTTNQVLTPAGRQVEFEGRPNAVALSPDGTTAALLNAGDKAIILIEVQTGAVKQEFDAAGASASSSGIVYAKDGKTIYASDGDGNLITANVEANGTLALAQKIKLPPGGISSPGAELNPYPTGLVLSEDGKLLYICLNRNNTLGIFDIASHSLIKEIKVGTAPANVVIAGVKAYVSNQGGRPAASSDFTVDSSGTPVVANKESGYATTGTVSVVDLTTGTEVKTIEVGLHPTALLLDSGRLFVANTNSDTVSMIDVTTDRVVKTIAIKSFPGVLLGSSPNALAMIDDERLAVSLGRNNALALYSLKGLKSNSSGAVQFLGLIPTGWYPADLAADTKARRLVVANNKGVGALGPEGTTNAYSGPEVKKGKSALNELGSVSIINFPTKDEVTSYTARVLKNNNWSRVTHRDVSRGSAAKKANPVPIPEQLGDPSVFKHIFYIIKENRTYDQVFGDLRQGNGDQNLVQFGRTVTPNHHALAEQFILFDNLYVAGTRSVDGHQWLTQSFVVDYIEKAFGGFARAYPFTGGDSLAYPQTGFIWESALRFGKSVRVYGEYVSSLYADDKRMVPRGAPTNARGWTAFYQDAQILGGKLPGKPHVKLEARSDIPSLDQIICREYPPYHQAIPDQYRAEVFLREFNEFVKNRNLPDLVILALTSDHSQGNAPNYPTPAAMMADNDLAFGRIVEAISNSPYWKDSVIFAVEDDAQFGVDHVSGNRTMGFVISAYSKRGVVDSRYYTQLDMNRTIEQILGLHPLTQMDMAVDPLSMRNAFITEPNLKPFKALPNGIALDTMNPSVKSLQGFQKQWALAMRKLDFSTLDAADSHLLNRVIWYSTKGFNTPYPGDDRILHPDEVHSYLKAKGERVDEDGDDD